MALSSVTYAGDGSTYQFALTFTYIEGDNVTVKVDGESVSFTFDNAAQVNLGSGSAPDQDAVIFIYRTTQSTSRLVDFTAASVLDEASLDKDSNQLFYVVQEAKDDLANALQYDNATGEYDADNKRIKNLDDGVSDDEAVNVGQMAPFVTDCETAQTAAEAAQTAAETAQTAAELAETNAETAETNAETAQAAAETAETNAETAETAAELAETNAETAQAAAETAETNAETAETNAETAETNAALAQGYSEEWAITVEDTLVTAAAGGNEVDEYSALHHSAKANAQRVLAETAKTNAETAETNAETAETNAETAQGLAETAKTAAELAETNAETAETNAETAETNAETAETGAVAAQGAAETAQTAAELAETNAQSSEDDAAADLALTNADVVSTNADVVLTGIDVTDAETAKTAAETAETNAELAETNAETAETNAETAETNAETAETAAVAAKDLAEDWASEIEDTPVGGSFSALHWAAKAEAFALSTPQLDEANEWTAQQNINEVTLTSSSNEVAIDADTDQCAYHNMTEATEIQAPTNANDGAICVLRIEGDGSSALTWAAGWEFGQADTPAEPAADGDMMLVSYYKAGAVFYATEFIRVEA